jgi:hypothetical protein
MLQSLETETSQGFRVDDSVFDSTSAYVQQIHDLENIIARDTIIARQNYTYGITGAMVDSFNERMNELYALSAATRAQRIQEAQKMLDDSNADATQINLLLGILETDRNDEGEAVAAYGNFGVGLSNAIAADVREDPQGVLDPGARENPWHKAARFLEDAGEEGKDALVGLFYKDPTKWISNVADVSGGSLRGLVVPTLITVLILVELSILAIVLRKSWRFFVTKNDASEADEKVLNVLLQHLPRSS